MNLISSAYWSGGMGGGSGHYGDVARIDADDMCAPDRFLRQLQYSRSEEDLVLIGSGLFIIDDISWLPYHKKAQRNNEWIENNNRETFKKLVEIYNSLPRSVCCISLPLNLTVNFTLSPLAINFLAFLILKL